MSRFEELMNMFDSKSKAQMEPLVTDMVFLEGRLDELRKLPFIKVNPEDPEMQKATPASKQYKELLQQYINIVKVISKVTGTENEEIESPLRKWVNARVDSGKEDLECR